eukprot:Gb_08003 [translate_table: standard]
MAFVYLRRPATAPAPSFNVRVSSARGSSSRHTTLDHLGTTQASSVTPGYTSMASIATNPSKRPCYDSHLTTGPLSQHRSDVKQFLHEFQQTITVTTTPGFPMALCLSSPLETSHRITSHTPFFSQRTTLQVFSTNYVLHISQHANVFLKQDCVSQHFSITNLPNSVGPSSQTTKPHVRYVNSHVQTQLQSSTGRPLNPSSKVDLDFNVNHNCLDTPRCHPYMAPQVVL